MNLSNETFAGPISPAINLLDVLGGMKRRKFMIIGLTAVSFAAALALVNYLKPVYSAEAQVLIGNLETPFDRVQSLDNQAAPGIDDRVVESQISVLKSEDLGRRVVAALNLQDDPGFNVMLTGMSFPRKIKITLGFDEDPRLKTPEQLALGSYLVGLSISQQPNSNVIAIKFSAGEGEIAARAANTLADTYIAATRESQSQPTERAREWLSTQIEALRTKLAASEQEVEKFRAGAGLLQGATMTLGTQEISELNSQITVAQAASAEAKARADAIRQLLKSKGSVESSPEILASPVIQRLKEQRTEATRAVGEISATYLPGHPKMIAAKNQIANIDRQIRGEALKIVGGLEEQARIAKARETSLRSSLEELKAKASNSNLDDVKLKALERNAGADRILLETMLSRFAEASARQDEAAQPGLARIIQSASAPTSPSFPKRGPMVLLITMAGLALGLGLAFLMEVMAAAARLTERITQGAIAQPAASPAFAKSEPAPEPAGEPKPSVQPSFAAAGPQYLAVFPGAPAHYDGAVSLNGVETDTAVKLISAWAKAVQRDSKITHFALASIGGGTGDTSVAVLALARAMAQSGRRVIVADLAQRGSWLENLCGVKPGPGISDLVSGEASFTKVIGRDMAAAVHLLRFGNGRSPRTLSLLTERLDSVLAALAQSYEVVIVNAGEAASETSALLSKCEAALIMAPAQRLTDAASTVRALQSSGLRAVRHVLIGHSPAFAPAVDINQRAVNA